MKKLILASAAALFATSAMAADLPEPTPPVDTVAPQTYGPTVFNWTGAYVGANVGGAFGTGKATGQVTSPTTIYPYSADPNTTGVIGGLYAGYNYQVTPNFVIGAETDISASSLQGKSNVTVYGSPSAVNYKSENPWLGTVRARAGVVFDRFMVYGTGGMAYGQQKVTLNNPNYAGTEISEDNTRVGWTIGGGVEGFVTDHLTARVEYLYTDLGSTTYSDSYGDTAKVKSNANIIRAGVAYKF